jgi:acyl transferase domain-containing protein/NAD(P)H-dependent flavin oxidoreductase YrpB (nitropropane dioxygenase family)/acyl carrier protein
METIVAITPAHILAPGIAIAATRAGAVGILDLGLDDDAEASALALGRLRELSGGNGRYGVRWDNFGVRSRDLNRLGEWLESPVDVFVLATSTFDEALELRKIATRFARHIYLEVHDTKTALAAQAAGFDGLIVKGHEAGGAVGNSSTFILLQELRGQIRIPYWVQGGIGFRSAAAAVLAGATGVVLAEQLWSTEESPWITREQKALWDRVDGSETIVAGKTNELFRLSSRHGRAKLREIELAVASGGDWRDLLERLLLDRVDPLVAVGQDIAFAGALGKRYLTTGAIVTALRNAIDEFRNRQSSENPLGPDSGLAKIHGTRFPIVQGPMTRVSDVAPFARAVADAGGLPFLALSVMRGPQARALLVETKELMGQKPWGVGILGFIPLDLRQEQMESVLETKPPFAIIAGGRPSQARDLEALGISAYLHVPSPGLLQAFVKEGARKFIFEGSECGGHTGPRTSFVLWSSAIQVLLDAEIKNPESVQVLFAGGIHDALSAAMVAVLAAPLTERGMKIGVLMGTAYLFTEEAVRAKAIVQEFQNQAIACRETALLQSGVGIYTRCATTPFCDEFDKTRRQLVVETKSEDQILMALEMLNIGRLRIASKGIAHNAEPTAAESNERYVGLDREAQIREGMYMMGEVARLRSTAISIAELHESVSSGAAAVLAEAAADSRPSIRTGRREPIAIVGMASLLPGAKDLRKYWQNILLSVDSVREVPEERWRAEDFFEPKRLVRDKVYSKWGAFLDDIAFDPTQFGIPPASLYSIEPVQLLALHVAKKALEDAGLDRRPFPRDRTSTIFAAAGVNDLGMDYIFRTLLAHYLPKAEEVAAEARNQILTALYDRQLPKWTEDSFPGTLANVIAGRVSNRFDLGGTNFTVDAACASSLAALDVGIRQLRDGDADVALIGSVDAGNSALGFMVFAQTRALSPRGRSRPFDDSADGIALGEGIAAMVLKRLADAERDGDRIYSVIKGIGSSSDGHSRSLTAPHPRGQVRAIDRAYVDAGIDRASVSLIEAHGTGTALGDKSETEALQLAFGEAATERQYCALGSVKSMIGHTKVTAGLAAMIKASLALKHRVLPPTIGVDKPSTRFDFTKTPFYINSEARPWLSRTEGQPRRCGVSAFGFGGTNFHVVLEEYRGDYRPTDVRDLNPRAAEIFAFARADRSEIDQDVSTLLRGLGKPEYLDLAALAHAVYLDQAKVRPKNGGPVCHLAVVASSIADLKAKLELFLREPKDKTSLKAPQGVYYQGQISRKDSGAVCFLFPGQGSQRINMLRDLVFSNPSTYPLLERADGLLEQSLPQALSRYIYPIPTFTKEDREQQQKELNDTHVAQPALGVVDLTAFDLLGSFGLRPNFVAGHSYGEYVAACAAGVISRDDLIRLSEVRGRIAAEASRAQSGMMAAVNADEARVQEAIRRLNLAVSVANLNAPDQTIIAGPADAIKLAGEALGRESMRVKPIPVTAAFHCGAMAGAGTVLAAELAKVEFHRPRVALFSNTTGELYPDEPHEIRDLLARHIAEPLRFVDEIEHLYDAGARVFIEAGPNNVLSGLVERILGARPHTTLGIDTPDRSGWLQLAHLLARAFSLGLPVNLQSWFQRRGLADMSLQQIFERAHAEANPGPKAWRVNGGRAIPWHLPENAPKQVDTPASKSGVTKSETVETPPRPMTNRATTSQTTTGKVHEKFASEQYSEASTAGEGRTKVSNHDPLLRTASPDLAHALDGESRFAHVQGSLSQLLEFQREQQETLRRFFEFQEQWLSGGPARSAETTQGRRVERVELQARSAAVSAPAPMWVPPAPVLPSFVVPAAKPNGQASPATASSVPPDPLPKPPRPSDPSASINVSVGNGAAAGLPVFPPTVQFKSDLLRAVEERTGYSSDMLDLDANMEADLGIDSIKRIEVFSNLKDQYPIMEGRSEETVFEELAGLKTLNSVIAWYDNLNATLGGTVPGKKSQTPSSQPEAAESLDTKASPDAVQRYAVTPVPAPRNSVVRPRDFPADRVILLVGDIPISSAAFMDAFAAKNYPVRQILPGSETRIVGEGRIEVDFNSLDSVSKLRSLLRTSNLEVGAIFNLAGLGEIARPGGSPHLEYARRLFLLAKVFEKDLKDSARSGAGWLVNLTAFDGQFGLRKTRPFPAVHAGTLGVAKSLAREWPGVRVKCIDVDPEIDPRKLVAEVLREVGSEDTTVEVGFTVDDRWSLDVKESDIAATDLSVLELNSDSVLLVTGGAYGITADVTRAVAEKFRPRLVLVGRSALPDAEPVETRALNEAELKRYLIKHMRARDARATPAEIDRTLARIVKDRQITANIEAMRAAGAQVEYHALDIRDGEAFGSLIDKIYDRWGQIDGVLHGAGVIDDKLVRDKSLDSFETVFTTKVVPATVLIDKLRPEKLKFLLFFSSIAGRYGNAGQCDYSAANEVLNKLAARSSHDWPHVHTFAINWGPWDGGMVNDGLRRLYATKGIYPVPVEKGKQHCLDELDRGNSGNPEIVVASSLQQLTLALQNAK